MARRIIFFGLMVALSLAAGLALPGQWLKPVFNYTGYYFMLSAFVLWMVLIVRITYGRIGKFFKAHFTGLLLCVGIMALAFHLLPPEFKILADETNLVGVSMAMLFGHTADVGLPDLSFLVYLQRV